MSFRYLAIFILFFCSAIYSYQLTYAFSFLIFIFFSWLFIYWNQFSFANIKKIPISHLTLISILLIIIILPIIQVALISLKGDFLPPASRIDMSTIAITKNLDVKYELFFKRFPEFFFLRENLMAVIFTGAFWGNWPVLVHFLSPFVLPFLAVAIVHRKRIILCFGLSAILIALQAGDLFPGNLLYILPFFNYIKYASILNIYFSFSIIILSSLGFNIFFKSGSSIYQKIVIGSTGVLIIACLLLGISLPGRDYSNSVLVLASITMAVFTFLISTQRTSKKFLFNTIFALIIISSIIFQYLIKNYHPLLNGQIYNDLSISELRNKEDHSLHFLMERPVTTPWVHGKSGQVEGIDFHPHTTAGNDEYSSFINLTDGSYKIALTAHGLSSFPITKNYYAFLSIPGFDDLLRKKFHYFNHIIPISLPDYINKLSNDPNLTNKLLKKSIGLVTNSAYHPTSIYLKQDVLDNVENHKINPLGNEFNVHDIEYKANNIKFEVTVNRKGLLTYTDMWDEGWHAKVNGAPAKVMKVFNILKGVELSAGTHQIEFYFVNWYLWSLITMNITYFMIFCPTVVIILKHFIHGKNT